jgi:hypothetical protein
MLLTVHLRNLPDLPTALVERWTVEQDSHQWFTSLVGFQPEFDRPEM